MLSHTHFRILDAYFENVQTLSFENDQAIRARRPHSHIQNFMQICISCTRVYVCLCVLCAQQRVLYRDHRLHAIRKWRGVKSFRFRFIRRCNVYLHSTIINLYRRIFFFFHFCRVCRSWLLFMVTVLTSVDASALPASREREYGYKKCWFSLVLLTDKL